MGLPPTPTLLRNFYAARYTEPERVAVAQLAMRAVGSSGRWPPEQIRPGRLVDHAVEAGRASGYASSARTASRSSCVHVATLGAGEGLGNVSGAFMDVARSLQRG